LYEDSEVVLKSRGGKYYPVPESLLQPLQELLGGISVDPQKKVVLDGELYLHGKPLNEIVSCARKPENSDFELEYHIFDLAIESEQYPLEVRQKLLRDAVGGFREELGGYIKLVPTTSCSASDDLTELHDKCVQKGYEGIMIKNNNGLYKFDYRSHDLLKYKEFKDGEWEIADIVPDVNGNGKIICHCPEATDTEDLTFGVTMGNMEERKWQLENKDKLIGKHITVQYQAKTLHNKPQFPTGKAIREGEFVEGGFKPHF